MAAPTRLQSCNRQSGRNAQPGLAGADLKLSAELLESDPHAGNADPDLLGRPWKRHAAPTILDQKLDDRSAQPQRQPRPLASRMAMDVGKRLLGDPKERRCMVGRKRHSERVDPVLDRDAAAVPEALGQPSES